HSILHFLLLHYYHHYFRLFTSFYYFLFLFFFNTPATTDIYTLSLHDALPISALAGGAMSKLFGGGQKAASGGIQGDVLATDNNTVGMGDAGIKSAIQGSNVPNPDEAVPSFVSGAMAKAGKGLLEGTLQA